MIQKMKRMSIVWKRCAKGCVIKFEDGHNEVLDQDVWFPMIQDVE